MVFKKGYKQTEEHKKKKNKFQKGCIPWNKGKTSWNKGLTKETDKRVRINTERSAITIKKLIKEKKLNPTNNLGLYAKKGDFVGKPIPPMLGKKQSKEAKQKISENSGMKNDKEIREKVGKTLKRLYREGKLIHPMKGKTHSKKSTTKMSKTKKRLIKEKKLKLKTIPKGQTYDEFYGKERAIEIKNKIFSAKNRESMLKGLLKRPTSYEQKISDLCIKSNIPFIYTGNGTFLIGHKNPDFINEKKKIAIEVYHNYFKIRDFGSCENYEKQRSEYFAKYGWDVIFIRTEEIEDKNWKEVCLNKIK